MRFLRGASLMYRYCREGQGYPNGRAYSLRSAVAWSWRFR